MISVSSSVRLVVFDWAGTTIDFGCMAPVKSLISAFETRGVTVTVPEVRYRMGLHKKDHVRALLLTPKIARRWAEVRGRPWTEADVDGIYRKTMLLQLEAIDRHDRLIPGLPECIGQLRSRGIKIAATTGYFRAAADRVILAAQRQGYVPDFTLGADEVPTGRPAPWMMFRIMEALGVYPPAAVVKVGDTPVDIAEGRNAGAWSVGVIDSSNEMGLSAEDFANLPEQERERRRQEITSRFLSVGAHAVIDSLDQLGDVINCYRVGPTAEPGSIAKVAHLP